MCVYVVCAGRDDRWENREYDLLDSRQGKGTGKGRERRGVLFCFYFLRSYTYTV